MSTAPREQQADRESPAWRRRVDELAAPALLRSPPAPWLAYELAGILLVPLMLISYVAWDRQVTTWVRTLTDSERSWSQTLSHAAHGNTLIPAMVILLALAWRRGWAKLWCWTALTAMGYATESVAVNVLKVIFGRHRPNGLLEGHYGFELFSIGYGVNSFPSGHSAAIGTLLGVAILLRPRFAPLMIVAALVWGSARVFSHSHYISDVLAGLYLGVGCTFAMYAVARRRPWWNRQFEPGAGD